MENEYMNGFLQGRKVGYSKALEFCKGNAEKAYHKGFIDGLKANEFKIGDVVDFVGRECVITAVDDETYGALSIDNGYFIYIDKKRENITPTGRHIALDFLKNYVDTGYQE